MDGCSKGCKPHHSYLWPLNKQFFLYAILVGEQRRNFEILLHLLAGKENFG